MYLTLVTKSQESAHKIDVSFSLVCPVIDNEFRHNIVKVMIMNLYSAKTIEEYSKVLYIELKLMNKGKVI